MPDISIESVVVEKFEVGQPAKRLNQCFEAEAIIWRVAWTADGELPQLFCQVLTCQLLIVIAEVVGADESVEIDFC